MWYLCNTCRQVSIASCSVATSQSTVTAHTDQSLLHHDDSVTEFNTPRFTTAGLWHADEESIVNMLLDKACEGLNQALATGDRYRARLLLRLLAGLTTANVVSMPSMFATLNHIVSTAVQVLQGTLDAGMLESGMQVPYTEYWQQAQLFNTCTLHDACFSCSKRCSARTVHRKSP